MTVAMTAAAAGHGDRREAPGGPWAALRRTMLAVVVPALILGSLMPAWAGEGEQRLPTDPVIRKGMETIRAAVVDHHTLITHRRLPVAMAHAFASRVTAAVDAIGRDTAADRSVRARLGSLLATVAVNARTIASGGESLRQMDALFAITRALDDYGAHFDHPGWTPVQARP